MPLDAYSFCPGGTGKKIKFCCPELLADLQKMERMLEGQQFQACTQHVARLLEKHPDRACLLATQTMLLRSLGKAEEARAAADAFLAAHPDNPLALAEMALLRAITEGGAVAIKPMYGAIVASAKSMHGRVYEALGVVSQALMMQGHLAAARSLTVLQASIRPDDRRPMETLMRMNSAPTIPLLLKDDDEVVPCRDGASWKEDFDNIVAKGRQGIWLEAECELAALAEQVGDAPEIWKNLAGLRARLANMEGRIEALTRYSSLDVPLEDAVEARAAALFLSEDPLGDQFDMVTLRYTVGDIEKLQAALAATTQAGEVQLDPSEANVDDDGPPPRAAFLLFDQEMAEADVTIEQTPRVLGQSLLFGRQTDREARLVVLDVIDRDIEAVKSLLSRIDDGELSAEIEEEKIGKLSATQEILTRNWRLPEGASQEQFQQLAIRYVEDSLLETWPKMPLGLLDGKTPEEMAKDESGRIKVLAAIMLLEYWLDQTGGQFDCNRLRSKLGLPTLDPIDPEGVSLVSLPLCRLVRLEIEKLSDEEVLSTYRRATVFGARDVLPKLAKALIERPALANAPECLQAYTIVAREAEDTNEALRLAGEGRELGKKLGQPCTAWDMLELTIRARRGEPDEFTRLLSHLQTDHLQEPGVAETLTQLLMQIGAIGPDGSLNLPAAAGDADSPLAVPGDAEPESGKIWTPDGETGGGEKGKIWTPDMG